MKRYLFVSVCAAAGTLVAATPAGAMGNKQVIPLTCDGTTYQVTVAGSGRWSPARDDNSTLVFHPTAFGEFAGTFTPADGSPAESFTEPPEEFQAQPPNGHPTIDCTYEVHFEGPEGSFHGAGGVTGYSTGAPKR